MPATSQRALAQHTYSEPCMCLTYTASMKLQVSNVLKSCGLAVWKHASVIRVILGSNPGQAIQGVQKLLDFASCSLRKLWGHEWPIVGKSNQITDASKALTCVAVEELSHMKTSQGQTRFLEIRISSLRHSQDLRQVNCLCEEVMSYIFLILSACR